LNQVQWLCKFNSKYCLGFRDSYSFYRFTNWNYFIWKYLALL